MARTGLAVCLAAAAAAMPASASAEFPGERWNTPFVQISGGDSDTVGALIVGLNNANEIYFYGSRPTRMEATVRGNSVDLRILDNSTGEVIAEQSGLPFSTQSHAVAGSIADAALSWMQKLECVNDCQVASVGGAAPQTTAVAQAPAPAPVPAPAAAAQPFEVRPVPAPAATSAPEIVPLAEPERPVAELEDPLDSLANLGASDVAPFPETGGQDADAVLAAAAAEAARPRLPEPAAATPRQPRVSLSTADRPRTTRPEPTPPAEPVRTPRPSVPEPTRPAAPAGGRSAESLAALTPQLQTPIPDRAPPQDIVPGVRLPQPRPDDLTGPVGEVLGVEPEIATGSDDAPDPSERLAVAEPATAAAPEPASRTAEDASDDIAIGDADTAAVTLPAVNVPEPAQPTQPSADTDTAALGTAPEQETGAADFTAPTPVPRITRPAQEAPSAPSTDIAALAPATSEADAAPSAPAAPEQEPDAPTTASDAGTVLVEPTAPAAPAAPAVDDGEGEQLALVNPVAPVETPAASALPGSGVSLPRPDGTADTEATEPDAPSEDVEVAAVDPTATGPTLANARWVGFTPAVYTGGEERSGAWISGPFDRQERTGWITDTATGATARVTFIWREGGRGSRTATLSRAAAEALNLGEGDVANVAVYLPR